MAAIPFEDLATKYLEWAKVKKSYPSFSACVSPSVEHFKGRLAHTITEHDVESFRAIRKDTPIFKGTNGERPRSSSMVNHELASLKHIFNKDMAWGLLAKNPAAKVEKTSGDERPGPLPLRGGSRETPQCFPGPPPADRPPGARNGDAARGDPRAEMG